MPIWNRVLLTLDQPGAGTVAASFTGHCDA
jgi:hypothetical protein